MKKFTNPKGMKFDRFDHLDGTVTLRAECVLTGATYGVGGLSPVALDRWVKGELIQVAMPMVPKDDREFLMSQISPTGWKQLFN